MADETIKPEIISFQCGDCKHFKGTKPPGFHGEYHCKAFKQIPDAIVQGDFIHTKPFKGDGGIIYEKQ